MPHKAENDVASTTTTGEHGVGGTSPLPLSTEIYMRRIV